MALPSVSMHCYAISKIDIIGSLQLPEKYEEKKLQVCLQAPYSKLWDLLRLAPSQRLGNVC